MEVHLLDGTYELFRQHFGNAARHADPSPAAGAIGVAGTVLGMLEQGATHIGVASDHVIESFRNDLWPGYKTSEGMPPELLAQIPVMEDLLTVLGVTVWRMVEWEADDALASAAAVAAADPRVERVLICTPDKDLGQCVRGERVVQLDHRHGTVMDEAAVTAKFGVPPSAIPDYLALVGDAADGFPGVPGFGAKTAAAVLARFGRLHDVPDDPAAWDVPGVRGVPKLAATLADQRPLAELFLRLATVVEDVPVGTVDDWAWTGPDPAFPGAAADLGASRLADRAARLAAARQRGS